MISERLLSAVMDRAGNRYLTLAPYPQTKRPAGKPDRRYLLYVHVPFCTRLCPYCSFNRFPFEEGRAAAYFKRLREEMRLVAGLGYRFTSMYVGGGTPTVVLEELCETIDLARSLFPIEEVSSETNPDHLTPEYVEALVPRVDRISVGVQSFDDSLLKQMERYDKYGSGAEILERLQSVSGAFHSLNVDMIFNFPSQTPEMLSRDIEMVKLTGANQTTFYPLMASPAVAESLARTVGRVDYDREARYYDAIVEQLGDAFEPASAWCFSHSATGMIDEYIVDYEEYIGLGSGAFSFLDGSLYVNTFSLADYNRAIDERRTPVRQFRSFPIGDRMRYRFLMSLFALSLDKRRFQQDFGVSIDRALPLEMAFMRWNKAFSVDTPERLELTRRGRYLLVTMMRNFFISVNNLRDQARAALPADERKLLFGDGDECPEEYALAAAVSETHGAEDVIPTSHL